MPDPSLHDPAPESAEALFASCLPRLEAGDLEAFRDLLAAHPQRHAQLEELFASWRRVHAALKAPDVARSARPPEATATGFQDSGVPFGPYRRIRLLGQGGQGEVWLAEDERLGRRVALKVLRSGHPERFRREAAIASRLDHPGICTVYESGEIDGVAFIAMRYVEGPSLAARIDEERASGRKPSSGRARGDSSGSRAERARILAFVRIVAGAARALHAAHEAGVVHRDVKPGNVLIGPDDAPVVVDFGFAGECEAGLEELTRSAEFFGTPSYMSPEQLAPRRGSRLDPRTDVWSLGVTLYEGLTWRRPFDRPSRESTYHAILTQEPEAVRRHNPAVSADLAVVVHTALEKDRDRRYRSALALAEDLEAVLDSRPIAARPISTIGRLSRWSRREPAQAALGLALLVGLPLLGVLGTLLVTQADEVQAGRGVERAREFEAELVRGLFELEDGETGAGDAVAAAERFRSALELEPDSVEATGALAVALLDAGRADAALEALDRLAAAPDAEPALAGLRAEALRALGREELARELERGLAPPTTSVGHLVQGLRELEAAEARQREHPGTTEPGFRSAEDALLLALITAPAPRVVIHLAYLRALGQGSQDPDRILESARSAIALAGPLEPGVRAVVLYRCAWAHQSIGRRGDARRLYRAALALEPDLPAAWNNLGVLAREEGDLPGAIEVYREAIASHPALAEPHANLGVALGELGTPEELEESIRELREALRLDPDRIEVWNWLGLLLRRSGDAAAAIEAYGEALRRDPGYAEAHRNLGVARDAAGDLPGAIEAFRRARELEPRNAAYALNLGSALGNSGDLPGAVDAFAEAVDLDPDLPEARFMLGLALLEEDLPEEALEHLERADELGSEREDWRLPTRATLERCRKLLGLDPREPR